MKHISIKALLFSAVAAIAASCISVDGELGKNFIPLKHKYDVKIVSFPIELEQGFPDNLSGYNSRRFTIGSTRDADFGLCNKSSSFTLIPIPFEDKIDMGENTVVRQFHFSAVRDTTSCPDKSQKHIIQNVRVYALEKELDEDEIYTNSLSNKMFSGKAEISLGTPLYDGGDSLSFDFSPEFAEKFIKAARDGLKTASEYKKAIPGIYICTDEPVSEGGRINIFETQIKVNESGIITGNYAELKITADYGERKAVDTSFVYYFGADTISYSANQYSLNFSEHESESLYGSGHPSDGNMYIEGGSGAKIVAKADYIREKMLEYLAENGTDPSGVIINKATVTLPYDYTGAESLEIYPQILSPTCRIYNKESEKVTYGGLTDASLENANQGDINRSLSMYSPDMSYHIQTIVKSKDIDGEEMKNHDIWFFIMYPEIIEKKNENSNINDYYNSLAYANYYNQMYDPYGYGYGYGYGGYYDPYGYGYGSYYDNYYNYMMMASMMGSGSTTVTKQISRQLDKDRYYRAVLKGPDVSATGKDIKNVPHITITYSVSMDAQTGSGQ